VPRRLQIGGATILVLVILWYLSTTQLGLISPGRFPSPQATIDALGHVIFRGYAGGTLIDHVINSLRLVVLGFLFAVATGVPLGLLMGWNRRPRR
jgi:taurine transport system permease protein